MARGKFSTVILAAGRGKRMGSPVPKVLQMIAGLPMLGHVIDQLRRARAAQIIIVIAPDMDAVKDFVSDFSPEAEIVIQPKPLGTADAARRALRKVKHPRVLIAYGDSPLVEAATYRKLARDSSPLTLCGFAGEDRSYGRIMCDQNKHPIEIIEDDRRAPPSSELLNMGIMAFDAKRIAPLLVKIGNNNPKREFYLTDLAKIAAERNLSLGLCRSARAEALGANRMAELAELEAIYQDRVRGAMLAQGVCLAAPQTVFFAWDTQIAAGVRIAPYVVFGPRVKVGAGVRIESFSHIAGAVIKAGAVIGPYARLRPEAEIGAGAHIGNFVEVKKARIGAGAKASHLAYIGDARIGKAVNIGAGVITCNYDGKDKHETRIGAGAFIGSNSALVAPIRIGSEAYIGSGSVVTDSVPPKALALGRARQVVKRRKSK